MNQRFNLLDHMEFVRLRLIRAALAYLAASVVGYVLTPQVMRLLTGEGTGLSGLVFLSPAEAFFARVKLAFALGLLIGLPFILHQAWGLIEPALDTRQRKWSWWLVPAASLLFMGGVVFAFVGVLPVALRFLLGFGGGLTQEISIANYISFVIGFLLPFGLVFELPIVIVFLTRIGVLKPRLLAAKRKYVVLVAFIVGAALTPPDVITQFMLAIPLIGLFEISLAIARLVEPREKAAPKEDPAGSKDHVG